MTTGTRTRRVSTFLCIVISGLLAACGYVDVIDGNNHRCLINYSSAWQNTDLRLIHDESTKCPVPVYSVGQDIYLAAQVDDPNADDSFPGELVELEFFAECGHPAGYDAETWYHFGSKNSVIIGGVYQAALGVTFCNPSDPDDLAVVSTVLVTGNASATTYLDVLFGERATFMIQPNPQTNIVFPTPFYCSFAAQSTLAGQPRTGMQHKWTLVSMTDGSRHSLGTADSFSTSASLNPGQYMLEIEGVDPHLSG